MSTWPALRWALVSTTATPSAALPSRSWTLSPTSAPVPERPTRTTGRVSSVMPRSLTSPWSLPASSLTLRMVGASGAAVSTL